MDAQAVADLLEARGWTLCIAESLTGGLLTNRFAVRPGASRWLKGGLVAYTTEVKHDILQVPDCPVVSELCATRMAASAAKWFGADAAVSATGVGGPDPQDGLPPGTVWIAVSVLGTTTAQEFRFDHDDPEEVCRATCDAAVGLLHRRLLEAAP